jgi:hypothetical protein
MSLTTRDIVIASLHKTAGILNDPRHARLLMAGQDVALAEIEMDSLDLFEVIMEIEDRLGLQLDADDVASQPSLHALVAFLDQARA